VPAALARFRRFIADEARTTGLPIGALIIAAVALHVAVTLMARNPWHPDEHFQILEFAWARAGLAPLSGLPWEFSQHIRPALQPALAMALLDAMRALGLTSPYAWTLALRLGTLALSFAVLLRLFASVSPTLTPRGRRVLWLVGLFVWYAPLLMSRFTSENLSGLALAAALTFAVEQPRRRGELWLALMLGLSFVFRFQMAFAIVPILLWLGIYGSGGWARVGRVAAGIAVVVVASTIVDAWFYGTWVFTPWEYFRVNIVEGVAAGYGASRWYAYFIWAPLWTAPPVGAAIIGLLLYALPTHRRSPWTWAIVGFLVAHFVVSHKELRFLFSLVYFVPVLVALGWDVLERRVRMVGAWRFVVWGLVAQNVVLALLLVTPSVHRGKEFDWQYFLYLWTAAEARPGRTVFVLQPEGDPYRVWNWSANVYRHARVRGVAYVPGEALPTAVPKGTPPAELLVVTRTAALPVIAGATGFDLVYEDEPGYRVTARWVGAEQSVFIRYLESVDNWTGSEWVRRVYRVRMAATP